MDHTILVLAISTIAIVLIFEYTNGFHDAANIIATLIASRAMTPVQSVLLVAFFEFLGPLLGGTAVADTIGTFISLGDIDRVLALTIVLCGLVGAIAWNLITWWFGIPSSSSHALIGGYGGAAVAKAGFGAIIMSGWIKTLMFIVLAPILGMVLGYFLQVAVLWIVRNSSYEKVNVVFRKLQLLSAALYSLGHGTNDAQKTMGIITGLLLTAGFLSEFQVPLWVILMSHCAIALGTLFGGWRIVKTMGSKITKLKPSDGFCAETAGGITLLLTAYFGIAVSTTHTIAGAIMGVGATKRLSAVRWGIAGTMLWAWILTIPASALVAAACYYLIIGVQTLAR